MERWIDGTALARFEHHMADVLPSVKAAAEQMAHAELAALARSPDRIAALGGHTTGELHEVAAEARRLRPFVRIIIRPPMGAEPYEWSGG